jgi:hypothetical protein
MHYLDTKEKNKHATLGLPYLVGASRPDLQGKMPLRVFAL